MVLSVASPVALFVAPRVLRVVFVLAQVIEGEREVVNIRDTNDRLGPLIFGLIVLGVVTLIGTLIFWFLTRPRKADQQSGHAG